MSAEPLDMLAAAPPAFASAEVLAAVRQQYGLDGMLAPLVSERDQNFRLETTDGRELVVKIANAAEPAEITDFQVRALQFLAARACPVPVPQVVPTEAGAVSTSIGRGGTQHVLRIVSYVAGEPLEGTKPGPELAFALGRAQAQLDASLLGFAHPGEAQVLLWDMQRASELRDVMRHVPDAAVRAEVAGCLDRFETVAEPLFPQLRSQVIHNDLNPGNVLVSRDRPDSVAGIIDFGDMVRAPLVVDVAVAMSYLRRQDDGFATLRAYVAGFESVTPLEPIEKSLLRDLVRMRLATTVTILHWRASARSDDDPYLQKALVERGAERFLQYLGARGAAPFAAAVFGPEN